MCIELLSVKVHMRVLLGIVSQLSTKVLKSCQPNALPFERDLLKPALLWETFILEFG